MTGMYNYKLFDETRCQFYEVGGVEDLPDGERLFLDIGELPIVVFNIAGGLYAIADVCSHDDGPVGDGELDGYEIKCPRHGARFDVRSGEVLSLPAAVDIPAYPVRVVDGKIEVGVPEES
jgi:3-phenylpropionate/trans-cinnamate dioxygenase ferredoxin component